jgi:cytochrome c peroxidase
MASASRTFTRALRTTAPNLRSTTTRTARFAAPAFQQQHSRRGYASASSEDGPDKYDGNPKGMIWGAAGLLAIAAGYGVYISKPEWFGKVAKPAGIFTPQFEDYQKVYDAVAKKLQDEDDYDDGSYGPVLVRLAWHASGTYDAETNTGGSNGATMRFAPEGDHGANAGLKAARDFLEPIKGMSPSLPLPQFGADKV